MQRNEFRMFINGLKSSPKEVAGKRETKNINEVANKHMRRNKTKSAIKM